MEDMILFSIELTPSERDIYEVELKNRISNLMKLRVVKSNSKEIDKRIYVLRKILKKLRDNGGQE
ncbi:hypothetical protein AR9_g185 [Bacillus phage AR9]|uniref:Uncharacterized protein n=1 Tax=Bacillus phage AR9 TaxID=1815509 RepID=A0A172JI98_BPPB1|nr:hypothetical protein BI022_gp184 [Bacillus phage AR9]AMS01269.1 hypothetical protein AR9_g185 [Bacillus phage AR9]PTU25935.1 hypothetical protein DA469_21120 [Bacillus subtilis]